VVAWLLGVSLLSGCGTKGGAKPADTASEARSSATAEARAQSPSLFGRLFGRSKFGTIEDLVKAGKDQEALAFYEQNRSELRELKPRERAVIEDLQVRVALKRLQALLDAELYDDVPRYIEEHRSTIDSLPTQKRAPIEDFALRARCGEFAKARRRGGAADALAAIERNMEILESPKSECRTAARDVIESERKLREARARELAARMEKLAASPKLASQAIWSELGTAISDGISAIDAYESQPLLRHERSEDVDRLKRSVQSTEKALRANVRAAFLEFDLFGPATFVQAYPLAPDKRVLADACEALLPRLRNAEPSQIKSFWSRYGELLSDAQKQRVGQHYVDSLQRRGGKGGFVASLPFLDQARRDGFVLTDWVQRIALLEATDPEERDVGRQALALDLEAPREYKIPVVRASLVVAQPVFPKPQPPEPAKPAASEAGLAASPSASESPANEGRGIVPPPAPEQRSDTAPQPSPPLVRATDESASGQPAPVEGPRTDAESKAIASGQPPVAEPGSAGAASAERSTGAALEPASPEPVRIAIGEDASGRPVEIVLREDEIRGKDMVIVVRFVKPRSTQILRDRTSVRSEYKSGERVTPNPAYLKAKREYEDARDEARAQALARSQTGGGGAAIVPASPTAGIGATPDPAATKRYVEVLEGILATTPETLSEPVYSRYSYVASKYQVEKSVKILYVVYEVVSKRMLSGQTTIAESRDFAVAEGVRQEDRNIAAIDQKYEAVANMEGYGVRSLRVPYDRVLADLRADIAKRW
jgi:hypothetical protein